MTVFREIVWLSVKREPWNDQVPAFLRWLQAENIVPAVLRSSGPFFYEAGFYAEDAARVKDYWIAYGEIRVHRSWRDE